MAVYLGCMVAFFLLTNQIFTLLFFVTQKLKNLRDNNTCANLGGSLVVRRCIDKPKWGNYPINLRF